MAARSGPEARCPQRAPSPAPRAPQKLGSPCLHALRPAMTLPRPPRSRLGQSSAGGPGAPDPRARSPLCPRRGPHWAPKILAAAQGGGLGLMRATGPGQGHVDLIVAGLGALRRAWCLAASLPANGGTVWVCRAWGPSGPGSEQVCIATPRVTAHRSTFATIAPPLPP